MIKEVYPKETLCYSIEWDGSNFEEIKKLIKADKIIRLDSQTLIIDNKFECLISDIIIQSKKMLFVLPQKDFKENFNEIKKPE